MVRRYQLHSDSVWLPVHLKIVDWHSRSVLSRRVSISMDANCCVTALKEAMNRYGVPKIFITDQDSPFTSYEFTKTFREAGARISMDAEAGGWIIW